MDLIISHKSCPDGFCAAFIAKKKYPEAAVLFCDHGLEPPYGQVTGADVLVLDFSWRTRQENDDLASVAKSFRILDHHKTAQAVLEGADYAVFDMKRSGAGLAWDYLFGEITAARPWYVDYVEDKDLWNWKLKDSREINAYIGTLPFTFEAWDKLRAMSLDSAHTFGRGAYAQIEHYVREAVQQAQVGVFHAFGTAVLNVPYLNCSEIGNELAKNHAVSLTWFERGDGMIQFYLRSIGNIDVSVIAKEHGGGGHKNAAGFQKPLREGRALVDKILGRNDYKLERDDYRAKYGL